MRPASRQSPSRFGPRLAAAVGVQVSFGIAFSCGGTTGREDLPITAAQLDATVSDADADADLDSGEFDVVIQYADQKLPDVVQPPAGDGGAEAGYPWPNCPPFIAIGANGEPLVPVGPNGAPLSVEEGGVIPISSAADEIPAAYDSTGAVVAAPDGSACATYGWLGSVAIDECMTPFTFQVGVIMFPPCNWCVDAGIATQGPGEGLPRYENCLNLYACIMSSGCYTNRSCLCTTGVSECEFDASGPCATEELASLEQPTTSTGILDALENFSDITQGDITFNGGVLNWIFEHAESLECFPPDAGPGL